MSNQLGERVTLGHITGVSGLKGWVKVHSDTNPRENIVGYRSWWLQQSGAWRRVKVVGGRPQGKTIVANIENVSSPEQASELIGAVIAVERTEMPKLEAGEYYWADLTGMQVCSVDGTTFGTITRLFETGANDVMVVADERMSEGSESESPARGSGKEILVPWLVPDVVTKVDQEQRIVTVDWDPDF